MGRSQRRKGYRVEHEIVKKLREAGLDAKRVPLSGATEFAKGDVYLEGRRIEVKARKEGFRQIYKWIEGSDFLVIKADRKEPLVIMRLREFIKLAKYSLKKER